ncbi:MAG: hypothetical protein LC106_08060 [Burkholderiales bacterium]|nr:hypothetical protein [Burkholderiales bacterium]
MAFVIKDRVFEYTTTTGTGTLTLAGTKSGYQQFATVGDGNTTYYTIVAENGDWESGIGTYTSSGTTLARTTVLASSNSNNLVNFAAGIKEVFSSQPAGRAVAVDTLATSTSLGTSNLLAPSQNAVKGYVDSKVEGSPFRNRIINGDFLVNQRHGGSAITLTSSVYNADRWFHAASQSSKASSQVITSGSALGSKNYLRMKTVSAATLGSGDAFSIIQSIEGFNVQDFNFGTAEATQITLSFWVRASQTGTYSVGFRNDDANRSYVTTYTISSANVWEYKTITINGDTSGTWKNDNTLGLSIYFDFGTGSTYTTSSTNTWLAGNFVKSTGTTNLITTLNATLDLALVQLEKGSVATSYEYIPISDSLVRCERYYQRCFANTRGYSPPNGIDIESPISFRTQMRVVPTATLIAGTRGNVSIVKISNPNTLGARHALISAAAGDTYAVAETAIFDAEL